MTNQAVASFRGQEADDDAARVRRSRSRFSGASGAVVAALGGLALWLAFPPHDFWFLAVAGPASLTAAAHGRRAWTGALFGLLLGLTFLVPLLSWTGVYVGPAPWLALAVYQALHHGALGAATAAVSRLRLAPAWIACLCVATEAARSRSRETSPDRGWTSTPSAGQCWTTT